MILFSLDKPVVQPDADYFFKNNAWWIALCFAGLIVIAVVAIFLSGKKKKAVKKVVNKNDYIEALGGANNIISSTHTGSRISVILNDYSIINKEKLKETGVDSFILMSNKLTLVFKGDAEKAYKIIFGE